MMSLFLTITGLPIQYWQNITRLEPSWADISLFLSGHTNLVLQPAQSCAVRKAKLSGTSEHQTCTDCIRKPLKNEPGLGHWPGAEELWKPSVFFVSAHTSLDLDWSAQGVGYAQGIGYPGTPRNCVSPAGCCERNPKTWQALQNFWNKNISFLKVANNQKILVPQD